MSRLCSRFLLTAVGIAIVGTVGCASTIALDRAVVAYDTTTAESVSKQLLLNIARARHNQPMHFTAISNIAATYKFTVNAGVGGDAGDIERDNVSLDNLPRGCDRVQALQMLRH